MKVPVKKRPGVRSGRPSRERAAKVDERILDAAEQVFLNSGFEGASIDEVAQVARAGKTTIYLRYAGKKELFAAVMLRNISDLLQIEESAPQGVTMEARLRTLGANIVRRAITHKTIHLFRVAVSEAERFPGIASQVSHLARERGIDEVARLLAEVGDAPLASRYGETPASGAEDARTFVDLIVLPMLMRRLFGEDPAALEAEISDHVAGRVAFFLAASKTRRPALEEA